MRETKYVFLFGEMYMKMRGFLIYSREKIDDLKENHVIYACQVSILTRINHKNSMKK